MTELQNSKSSRRKSATLEIQSACHVLVSDSAWKILKVFFPGDLLATKSPSSLFLVPVSMDEFLHLVWQQKKTCGDPCLKPSYRIGPLPRSCRSCSMFTRLCMLEKYPSMEPLYFSRCQKKLQTIQMIDFRLIAIFEHSEWFEVQILDPK